MKLTPMISQASAGDHPQIFAAVMGPTMGPAAAIDLK
jgi:hypothetical protein